MSEEAKKGEETSTESERIAWHPAFFVAVQMELEEYRNDLQFISEYQLNTEPLKIDVVIIKKTKDTPIEKNIATIFKQENILEYKSPDDYISVDDFYKVYGYACLYKVLNKIDIRDLTLTFAGSRYPRELLAHLQEIRGYTVEEKWPGIYTIKGDILPIQVINSRKLSADENLWLRDLDNQLGAPDIQRVSAEIDRLGKTAQAQVKTYLNVVLKANIENLREVLKMSDSLVDLFAEIGLAAKWEAKYLAEGKEIKAIEIARNLLNLGDSTDKIIAVTGLSREEVENLRDTD
ncbi:MAG: hypothetical protein LBQ94_00605 [Treponema sp.]|jgi:hypothetical protein|nr:hypothetical protein [Treponema sp.]